MYLVFASCLIVMLYLIQKYFKGAQCKSKARLDGKNFVITGCNAGIGKETAIDLCKRGARVIMACRNVDKMKAAAQEIIIAYKGSGAVALYRLDLSDLNSVRKCAEEINNEEEHIDCLINNAGVVDVPYEKTKDGLEMHMATNHFGHFLFTNLLLDKLKASGDSRIVTVSSLVHRFCSVDVEDINWDSGKRRFYSFRAYCQSKTANILFTSELARRLKGTDVTCYAVHPGVVRTDVFYQFWDSWTTTLPIIMPLKILQYLFFKTAKDGAQTSIYCAVDPMVKDKSGKYFADCRERMPSSAAKDPTAALKLWELSEQMVGLK